MKLLITFLLILTCSTTVHAETITLKSGLSIEGDIVELTDDTLVLDRHRKGMYHLNFEDLDTKTLAVIKSLPKVKPQKEAPAKIAPKAQQPHKQNPNKSKKPLSAQEIFTQNAASVVIITAQLDNGQSQGSGYIASSDGSIVTNFHVIAGANQIDVRTKDGRTFPVTGVIAYKPFRDLCILKIDAHDLPTTTLTDSNKLKPGQTVYVIGAPLGYEYSITDGIFSATREMFGQENLQISAPISPGNSGGPVFDEHGYIIGISTFMLVEGQNMNFAIPSNDIQPLLSAHNANPKPIDVFLKTSKYAAQDFSLGTQNFNNQGSAAAIPYFEKALNNDPDMIDALIILSSLNSVEGSTEKAVAYAQKAVALNPHDPDALTELGNALAFNNQWAESINVLNQSLTLKPGSRILFQNLAVSYEKTDQLDKALETIHKAIDIAPFNYSVYLIAGWIYHRLKNTTAAVEFSEKALGLNPEDTQTMLNLSAIYLNAGHKDTALSYAQRYTNLGGVLPKDLAAQLGVPDRTIPMDAESFDTDALMQKAALFEKQGDLETSYRLSQKALANIYSRNKEDFLIAFEIIRRGTYLSNMYFNQAFKDSSNQEASMRAFDLAKESIAIIEDWGGLHQIIDADKKYRGFMGFNPALKNDIKQIFTMSYFIIGLLSTNNDISLMAYNAIKDYDPNKAKIIIDTISMPKN